MKKLILLFAVVAFIGVLTVPAYSIITINSTVVLDDPPKTVEVNKAKTEKTAKKETAKKEASKADCEKTKSCDKATKTACCSQGKKK